MTVTNGPRVRGVLDEITRRLADLRRAETARGGTVHPPVLALGTFERVGSNWFADTVRAVVSAHNEPFRQQLHPSHPWSPLNPNLAAVDGMSLAGTTSYAWHWLVTFALSKYGTTRHVIKETNLFFALPHLLALFPDAPVVVLTRDPIGIVSSFARADLFDRWGYAERYAQMSAMVARPGFAGYRFAARPNHPNKLCTLARLIVLNTLLVAEHVDGRAFTHIGYEEAVTDQAGVVWPTLRRLFGVDPATLDAAVPSRPLVVPSDATFDTRQSKRELVAFLEVADVAVIADEVDTLLSQADGCFPAEVVARARRWLTAHTASYRLAGSTPPNRPRPGPVTGGAAGVVPVVFVAGRRRPGLWWRNTLVTNAEFCVFLNAMRKAKMPNVLGGTYLFANEAMPSERGGRLCFDAAAGGYRVQSGYEQHPVYWVTWLGAAAFARYVGCRLPAQAEIDALVSTANVDLAVINADYRVGDVVPVAEPAAGADHLHHVVGNVQVWCADGPTSGMAADEPATRYLYGAAWNTPASLTEIRRPRARHLTGCSRGVGVRLVRDEASTAGEPAARIAERLWRAFAVLRERGRSLSDLDADFADLLAAP